METIFGVDKITFDGADYKASDIAKITFDLAQADFADIQWVPGKEQVLEIRESHEDRQELIQNLKDFAKRNKIPTEGDI